MLPEFSHLGLAAAVEPLFIANWLAQKTIFEWTVISADGSAVRASNGIVVPVSGDLSAATGCQTVFVLASFEPGRALREPQVLPWLKRLARSGVELCGIENGSWVLAAAGLLNERVVAVHWDNVEGFQEKYPATSPVSQLFARRGARVTCAGASAILDLLVAWIGWHGHADLAAEVAKHLLMGASRDGALEQGAVPAERRSRFDAVVEQAEAIMRRHVDEPLRCAEVARRVGLSLRQIERLFKQQAGCSVLQRYRLIRMSKAHQLLQQTDSSVTQIALACGFSSPEYFCRLYRRLFACSPSNDRRQTTTAPVLRQIAPSRSVSPPATLRFHDRRHARRNT